MAQWRFVQEEENVKIIYRNLQNEKTHLCGTYPADDMTTDDMLVLLFNHGQVRPGDWITVERADDRRLLSFGRGTGTS